MRPPERMRNGWCPVASLAPARRRRSGAAVARARCASSAAAGAGRQAPVSGRRGIRPTPDRVRETLFNWLRPRVTGARCLDLFAGCGALGLEALSRGAAHVVFVEQRRRRPRESLQARLQDWQAQRCGGGAARDAARVPGRRADAVRRWCSSTRRSTPMLLARCARLLEAAAGSRPAAFIYIECAGARRAAGAAGRAGGRCSRRQRRRGRVSSARRATPPARAKPA